MQTLRSLSRWIDQLNRWVGRTMAWLVLLAVLVSSGNAVLRKAAGLSSNLWLELQWYLYGAAFLLAAGYVLMVDEHVRIDAVAQRFSPRLRAWIDIVVLALFVLPACAMFIDFGGAYFWSTYQSGEGSYNAGGLIRWPINLCIPVGFTLLGLQAVSELIKRADFLRGGRERPGSSEADLPEFLGAGDEEAR